LKILRYKCEECGLEMALPEKPDKCFNCGSDKIIRIGWRLRFKDKE